MQRLKKIQVTVTEEQKNTIELFVTQQSLKDNKRYTVSSYLLNIILQHFNLINNKNN
jgi:hypothetical protein